MVSGNLQRLREATSSIRLSTTGALALRELVKDLLKDSKECFVLVRMLYKMDRFELGEDLRQKRRYYYFVMFSFIKCSTKFFNLTTIF